MGSHIFTACHQFPFTRHIPLPGQRSQPGGSGWRNRVLTIYSDDVCGEIGEYPTFSPVRHRLPSVQSDVLFQLLQVVVQD